MKKRISAVILALLMVIAALPVGVLAADAGIEVQNSALPEDGIVLDDTMGDTVYTAGSGTITWDAARKTLTMENATMDTRNSATYCGKFGIKFTGPSPADYTIILKGQNKITSPQKGICLFSDNSTLTITGDGSLDMTISGSANQTAYGIGTYDANTGSSITNDYSGNIVIAGGTVGITITSTQGSGIYSPKGSVLVTGGTLEIKASENPNGMLQGICLTRNLFRVTGGAVDVSVPGPAIKAAAVRIDDGTVTAKSTATKYYGNYGIEVESSGAFVDAIAEAGGESGTLTINGGTVTAVGGLDGLKSDDMIRLYGGTVTAATGNGINPCAIQAYGTTDCAQHPNASHIDIPSTSSITPEGAAVSVSSGKTCILASDGTVAQNVTITGADAVPHKVTVTGTGTGGTAEGVCGYYLPGMTVPVRAGTSSEAFGGWTASPEVTFADASANETTFIMPDSDVTVTANWGGGETPGPGPDPDPDPDVPTYRLEVYYVGDLPEGVTSGAGLYPAGTEVTIYAGTETGFVFRSWATPDGSQITFKDGYNGMTKNPTVIIMPARADEVHAYWTDVSTRYDVIVDTAGGVLGEGESNGTGKYIRYETGTLNAGTRAGYTFAGWSCADTTGVTIYEPKNPNSKFILLAERSVRITATWKEDPANPPVSGTYHVTVNTDGGILAAGETSGEGDYLEDAIVRVNAGTKEGFAFDHWEFTGYTPTSGVSTANPMTILMPGNNIAAKAVWKPTYLLTVQCPEGVVGASVSKGYAADAAVRLKAGTLAGYTFRGWTTDSSDVTINRPEDTEWAFFTMPNHAVTVTANWVRDNVPTYEVTISGGGNSATGAGNYEEGQTVSVSAGTREGYTFAGWVVNGTTLSSGISASTAVFTMPAGAVSLRACWTPAPTDGVMTLYLDELPGPVTINYEGYTCANEGNVRHSFSGKSYILTQKTPGAATANTVTVTAPSTAHQFNITLKDVNIAGTDRAAFRVENLAQVRLTLEGSNILRSGANHAGLEMVSDTGYEQTTVTIKGEGSLSATGGAGGAGIGGSLGNNFGVVNITGGAVTAQGGAGAAGIGGGSCYAGGGTGAGCANVTGNAVYITGGTVTATAGGTSGSLRGAAGIGTGEGLANQSGGPYVIVRISGGDVTAQGAGQAPAIGGTYIGNIRITGGTVTTKANSQCATEIGVYPTVTNAQGAIRQVRLSDDSTNAGNAVVFVTKAGAINDQPSSAYAGDNYNWNGIVYEGNAGQLYVSVNAGSHIVERENLTVPAGKTLNIPLNVLVKLPAEGTVSGKLSGDGRVQVGETLYYIKADGTIAPCEVEYTDTDSGVTTPSVYSTLESLLDSPFLRASGHHIRLLADVTCAKDISFPNCSDVELDLNGHTLDMGAHQLDASMSPGSNLTAQFTVSDTSQAGSGRITGNSSAAVVLSTDGYLAISGGTFKNTGSGPAVQFDTVRQESRLTGGTFSRILISTRQGFEPTPLTSILGGGLAFRDEAVALWISPASKKSELSGVSVQAKALPAVSVFHEKGSTEAAIAGLSASAYQWLYSETKDGAAASLEGAVGPVLYLDDGTLPDNGYISCRVTADGETILTDAIFVNATKPSVQITVAPGTYVYNGQPYTPAVTVTDLEGNRLEEGRDYTLSYKDNVFAGQAFAVVTPPEENALFANPAQKSFVIAKAPLTVQAADQTVQSAQAVQSGASMVQTTGLANGDRLTDVTVAASEQQTVPSAAKIQNAAEEDVTGCYEITYRSGVLTVTGSSSGGSSSGGSSSGGSSSGGSSSGGSGTSSSVRNPDGSVTATEIDRATGTVTTTTWYPDGSVVVVETLKDGSVTVTSTETDSSGIQRQTVKHPDGSTDITAQTEDGTVAKTEISTQGQMASTVTLSQQAVATAQGEPVVLPLPAVPVQKDPAQASTVTVVTPGGEPVKAAVPVSNVTAGTVAVLVHPDGSEEVIKKSLPGQDSIVFPVESGATVKIVDNTKAFDDISETYWASSSIDFVSSRQLFIGTSETTFSPTQTMTRGMLMTVLARLDGQDTSGGSVWYAPGVSWAIANHISDGSLPEADISREQLVVMLYRYAGSPTAPDLLLDFVDADQVSDYAVDAMRWAVSQGILQGKTGNSLAPGESATRAEVARMLENYLKVL